MHPSLILKLFGLSKKWHFNRLEFHNASYSQEEKTKFKKPAATCQNQLIEKISPGTPMHRFYMYASEYCSGWWRKSFKWKGRCQNAWIKSHQQKKG